MKTAFVSTLAISLSLLFTMETATAFSFQQRFGFNSRIISENNQQVESLKSQVSQLEAEVSRLKQSLSMSEGASKASQAAARNQITALNQSIVVLNQQLSTLNAIRASMMATIESQKQTISSQDLQIAKLKAQVEGLLLPSLVGREAWLPYLNFGYSCRMKENTIMVNGGVISFSRLSLGVMFNYQKNVAEMYLHAENVVDATGKRTAVMVFKDESLMQSNNTSLLGEMEKCASQGIMPRHIVHEKLFQQFLIRHGIK